MAKFTLSFMSIQDCKCKYKQELAAAFVKNVVNITLVSEHNAFLQKGTLTSEW